VLRNGPADRAGMRPGDILVEVNGSAVHDTTEMLNLIAQLEPGKKARMKVVRKNEESKLDIVVGTRPRTQREAE
jgi:serine protease DegQ